MSTSKILITGITGQDGIFLSSNLIENYGDVEIIGTTRSKTSSQFFNNFLQISNEKKLKSINVNRFRISVSKSLNNLSAQIIDDKLKKTLVSASSIEKEIKLKKVKKMEKSSIIGEILAKRAKEKKINEVYFDRGSNKYHGRVKSFADSLRKNGLKF